MSCFTELTIEFEHTLYQVDIKEDDTILDLKKSIYLATQLEPSRQIFCNLFLPGNFIFILCIILLNKICLYSSEQ